MQVECKHSLPAEVTAKNVELPLGVTDDGVTNNGFVFLIFIVTGLIVICPHSGKLHESTGRRRARMRGSDDENSDANCNGGSGNKGSAQKRPTAAHSLHGDTSQWIISGRKTATVLWFRPSHF